MTTIEAICFSVAICVFFFGMFALVALYYNKAYEANKKNVLSTLRLDQSTTYKLTNIYNGEVSYIKIIDIQGNDVQFIICNINDFTLNLETEPALYVQQLTKNCRIDVNFE